MSADGEIEVSVKADGVDDAAEDLSDADGGVAGGGEAGEGGQQGGLRGSLRAGLLAGLLTAVSGPLLDVLGAVLEVLNAFLAPVAVVLMRLLSPVLRFLLTKILPLWVGFLDGAGEGIDTIGEVLGLILLPILAIVSLLMGIGNFISSVPGKLDGLITDIGNVGQDVWNFVSGGFSDVVSELTSLPGDIWTEMQQLPGLIGQELAERLPNVNPLGNGGGGGDGNILTNNPAYDAGREVGAQVNINGGLSSFVETVETESGIDIP